MSVTRGTESRLCLWLRCGCELLAGNLLSVPGVRSQPVGGEEDPGWVRWDREAPGLARTSRGPTLGGFRAGAPVRGRFPYCGIVLPVQASLNPLTLSGCDPPLKARSGSLGFSGAGPTPACPLRATYQRSCVVDSGQI